MESVENVTAEIQSPVATAEPPVEPMDEAPEELSSALPGTVAPTPEVLTLAEPLAQLIETGIGFLQQLATTLPANGGGSEAPRRTIETRRDTDGSLFLAVPMPSRETVVRVAEGLFALLRSLQS